MRALSLEYHDVVLVLGGDPDATGFPGAAPASYKLTALEFEHHLEAIARAVPDGPTVVGASPRPASLYITFDDGGVSAVSCIAERLERWRWRGHFFVTAGMIGTRTFVSADHIRDLRRRGHVIGSHSMTHPTRMGACTLAQLEAEWRDSVSALADILGEPVVSASVPGGLYSRRVAETAAAAGIRALFTSKPTTRCEMVDDCLVLGRYTIRRWTPAETAAALAAGRWRPRASQWLVYRGLDAARWVAGDRYTALRQLIWQRLGD
jgi:peptidoglycan/xylan/chitin deacetylase (PgdA/CDA1 family)